MAEDQIEFKRLESRLVGSDIVTFKLEDNTLVKIRVDLTNVGIAVNFKNPDGSPHYNCNVNVNVTFVPANRTYYVPRDKLSVPTSKEQRTIKPI